MSIITLIKQLDAVGITYRIKDGGLVCRAPKGQMSAELKADVEKFKPTLIKIANLYQLRKQMQALNAEWSEIVDLEEGVGLKQWEKEEAVNRGMAITARATETWEILRDECPELLEGLYFLEP